MPPVACTARRRNPMETIRIETKATIEVYRQLCELAEAHTEGCVDSMLSVIVIQACTGADYAYAMEREQELKAELEERKAQDG